MQACSLEWWGFGTDAVVAGAAGFHLEMAGKKVASVLSFQVEKVRGAPGFVA